MPQPSVPSASCVAPARTAAATPGLPRRRALGWLVTLTAPAGCAATADDAGRVWRVGPGEALTRVADAVARAGDGDTIEVLPGRYAGDVAVIRQRRLRIVGLGQGDQRPVLAADGRHAEGKAIWVLRDGALTVQGLVFEGCRVPDGNGAGIRFERGRLTLRDCLFRDHQMGLLTGADPEGELDIERCTFADAPDNPRALPHLLYVGRIARLRLHDSVLRQGRVGHLLKCRARVAEISGNRLDDGRSGRASYEIDLPNGGLATVVGNTVVQSPLSENAAMLSFGAEGQAWPDSRLLVADNTFVNHRAAGGWFVRVWADRLPPGASVLSRGNRWLGPGELALGPAGRAEGDRHGPAPD